MSTNYLKHLSEVSLLIKRMKENAWSQLVVSHKMKSYVLLLSRQNMLPYNIIYTHYNIYKALRFSVNKKIKIIPQK